ncbi:MAG: TetM/TetW/TetO/TetS family tetracycline resistance ribosomal protection protein [Lachnospiraceae bacterium]|nr:TetM/TetW/TetO/TetS family tetracycline resistance ribosomal protection protein [Lachnospiraceae bacterium]
MKKIVLGIVAHVDAGKTTLAEGLLFSCGKIRKMGRVDHKDAFLDYINVERERGITVFSKQAQVAWKEMEITLLDTPGHVDFSAEMERTLQVLDYCLLVIDGPDGVQGHVSTIWKLLKQYRIPTFLFVNKMDQPGAERERILRELQSRLDPACHGMDLSADAAQIEEIALCHEQLMEEYLETGTLTEASLSRAISNRHLFPCYFGSALHLQGVEELLEGLRTYATAPVYPEKFGARVYKISRDSQGNRLTHMKITGGALEVKHMVCNSHSVHGEAGWEEKVDQIRIYNGGQYRMTDCAYAGEVCAVTGLSRTYVGQGLGIETENTIPILAPVLSYGLLLPEGCDPIRVLPDLRKLEEEDPQLLIQWKEATKEIQVQVMGEVQLEILKRLMFERLHLQVEFTEGKILYRETIASTVVGIGHFEPLRHYAEVQLLLEPGEPGSGIQMATACSEDVLEKNWQRLIFTHLEEKKHVGVLTGAPVTDVKITLLAGRAHTKHTEGGDFRQATYRAVRQGLMQAQCVLLEPVISFVLEVPTEYVGRAMTDIRRMHGTFQGPETQGETSILTGTAPVATFRDYARQVTVYTKGYGRLSCSFSGYEPCHNQEEIIEAVGYRPEADVENPASSVFCAHGAGFVVPWYQVEEYAHLEEQELLTNQEESAGGQPTKQPPGDSYTETAGREKGIISQEEIDAIFLRTYGKTGQDYAPYRYHQLNVGRTISAAEISNEAKALQTEKNRSKKQVKKDDYLLIDGYNIIFAWEDLRELAKINIDSARDKLMDICCNYQGYIGGTLILVFDAYKVKGNPGSVEKHHNIYVVYTKEAETADAYIEKTVHEIGRKHNVTVATSDALEQMIIWGEGANRMSALGLKEAVEMATVQAREEYLSQSEKFGNNIIMPM